LTLPPDFTARAANCQDERYAAVESVRKVVADGLPSAALRPHTRNPPRRTDESVHDGGYAVWVAETNVIEVYDSGRKLLKTASLGRSQGGEAG